MAKDKIPLRNVQIKFLKSTQGIKIMVICFIILCTVLVEGILQALEISLTVGASPKALKVEIIYSNTSEIFFSLIGLIISPLFVRRT